MQLFEQRNALRLKQVDRLFVVNVDSSRRLQVWTHFEHVQLCQLCEVVLQLVGGYTFKFHYPAQELLTAAFE